MKKICIIIDSDDRCDHTEANYINDKISNFDTIIRLVYTDHLDYNKVQIVEASDIVIILPVRERKNTITIGSSTSKLLNSSKINDLLLIATKESFVEIKKSETVKQYKDNGVSFLEVEIFRDDFDLYDLLSNPERVSETTNADEQSPVSEIINSEETIEINSTNTKLHLALLI